MKRTLPGALVYERRLHSLTPGGWGGETQLHPYTLTPPPPTTRRREERVVVVVVVEEVVEEVELGGAGGNESEREGEMRGYVNIDFAP